MSAILGAVIVGGGVLAAACPGVFAAAARGVGMAAGVGVQAAAARRREDRDSIYRPASRSEARRQQVARVAPQQPPVDLTASLKAQIERYGVDGFTTFCDVAHVERNCSGTAQAWLLDPPLPWRGHLRLLYAVDPNPGPDGKTRRVLLAVRAHGITTCRQAAAATFGIHPANYRPERET